MRTVEQYMTLAPTAVGPDTPVADARELMRECGVHHLPVLRGKHLVGLVTETDLSAYEDLPDIQRHRLRIEDVMVPMPLSVLLATPLEEVAREMIRTRSSAAVVSHQGEVVGVFTLTDALRALIEVLEGGQPMGRPMPQPKPYAVGR
jgi:CBS domain-containing protein